MIVLNFQHCCCECRTVSMTTRYHSLDRVREKSTKYVWVVGGIIFARKNKTECIHSWIQKVSVHSFIPASKATAGNNKAIWLTALDWWWPKCLLLGLHIKKKKRESPPPRHTSRQSSINITHLRQQELFFFLSHRSYEWKITLTEHSCQCFMRVEGKGACPSTWKVGCRDCDPPWPPIQHLREPKAVKKVDCCTLKSTMTCHWIDCDSTVDFCNSGIQLLPFWSLQQLWWRPIIGSEDCTKTVVT